MNRQQEGWKLNWNSSSELFQEIWLETNLPCQIGSWRVSTYKNFQEYSHALKKSTYVWQNEANCEWDLHGVDGVEE